MPTPYIFFDGTCRDAMTFYASIFGGTPDLMPWSEAPEDTPEHVETDRIMHAYLAFPDGSGLMAADNPASIPGMPQQAVSISHMVEDAKEGTRVFGLLAEGGQVLDSFEPKFFAEGFGMVVDKFGTSWMIHTPLTE